MSYDEKELSEQLGEPIEMYWFNYDNNNYLYTSSQYNQQYTINGESFVFNAEFIHRSDSLKLGNTDSTKETCIVTVPRDNSVALLYQGAPPEQDSVTLQVYRLHGENNLDYIKIIDGVVSQVRFSGSEAELTITIENVLTRTIPKGTFSYFCQNCIYDSRCRLKMNEYAIDCFVKEHTNVTITSDALLTVEDGYFTDGFIRMGNCFRQIKQHSGDKIYLKYPINPLDWTGSFKAYPGCSNLFTNCAKRFGNQRHFSGIPYIQPYNAYKHKVINDTAYWVDSEIISRDTDGVTYTMGV